MDVSFTDYFIHTGGLAEFAKLHKQAIPVFISVMSHRIKNTSEVSLKTISKETGLSISTVQRALDRLEKVTFDRVGREKSRGATLFIIRGK